MQGMTQLVQVNREPSGAYTATAVGLPEIQATAGSVEEAVREVRDRLQQSMAEGRLVPIVLTASGGGSTPRNPNDPLEREFLEDLERYRREDLERTLQEDQQCSGSSSTPIT